MSQDLGAKSWHDNVSISGNVAAGLLGLLDELPVGGGQGGFRKNQGLAGVRVHVDVEPVGVHLVGICSFVRVVCRIQGW